MCVHHVRSLDKESLAIEIYYEQVKNHWPGLAQETEDICSNLGIEDVNVTMLSRTQFSKVVDTAIIKNEDDIMKSETTENPKMKRIREDAWGMKDYAKHGNLYTVRSTW